MVMRREAKGSGTETDSYADRNADRCSHYEFFHERMPLLRRISDGNVDGGEEDATLKKERRIV
jgi:hypothetical protein